MRCVHERRRRRCAAARALPRAAGQPAVHAVRRRRARPGRARLAARRRVRGRRSRSSSGASCACSAGSRRAILSSRHRRASRPPRAGSASVPSSPRTRCSTTRSPLEVPLWDRLMAYGAALGVAGGASRPLPMGVESDHEAWSAHSWRRGGTWRSAIHDSCRSAGGLHPIQAFLSGFAVAAIAAAALFLFAPIVGTPTGWPLVVAGVAAGAACAMIGLGVALIAMALVTTWVAGSSSQARSCACASPGQREAPALLRRRRRRRIVLDPRLRRRSGSLLRGSPRATWSPSRSRAPCGASGRSCRRLWAERREPTGSVAVRASVSIGRGRVLEPATPRPRLRDLTTRALIRPGRTPRTGSCRRRAASPPRTLPPPPMPS